MTITATLDLSKMLAVIRQFPSQTETTQDDFLRDQCRLLISTSGRKQRGLVQVTPPHNQGSPKPKDGSKPLNSGRGNDAKQSGINAVSYDLARVYANAGAAWKLINDIDPELARAFWQARRQAISGRGRGVGSKKQGVQLMNEILSKVKGLPAAMSKIESFDGGTAHAERFQNGRLRGKNPSILMLNTSKLNTYRKRKHKNVGIMASMIPFAASFKLGALKGIPSWVKRHQKSGGYFTKRKTTTGASYTIGVTSYVVNNMQRRMSYVLDYRMRALKSQLPHIARKLEKKLASNLQTA